MSLMRCDIVIATWNAVAMTQAALASIRSEANFPYRLILVDNSDEEDARAYFRDIAASGNSETPCWFRTKRISAG